MTTITLKINEKTKKGKALLAFLKAFYAEKDAVQVVDEPKSPYNKEFVAKIEKARKEKGREILPNENLWETIE
jgi:N-acetyl-gamma-glutamylphosphate reductase